MVGVENGRPCGLVDMDQVGLRPDPVLAGKLLGLFYLRPAPAGSMAGAAAVDKKTLLGDTMYAHIKVPTAGQKITVNKDYSLNVPDQPIIPYIEGDGTGVDITPVMIKVVDAAVAKAYGGKRKIVWMEIYAGEKSTKVYGPDVWLPDETLSVLREYVVSIKGPLTTPVGGGIRSINVAMRQELDLYVCLRPIQYLLACRARSRSLRRPTW